MLRGVAMLLMALDHSSYFAQFDVTAETYDGVRPILGSWPHVVTGLVTNLASNIFFTLAGVSVAFFEESRRRRGWSEWMITRFLVTRALVRTMLSDYSAVRPEDWRFTPGAHGRPTGATPTRLPTW